jgi:hypothetical protein
VRVGPGLLPERDPSQDVATVLGRRQELRPSVLALAIRRYGERGNNLVHWSDFERGGHFAAMEVPDLLVGDVRAFFAVLG